MRVLGRGGTNVAGGAQGSPCSQAGTLVPGWAAGSHPGSMGMPSHLPDYVVRDAAMRRPVDTAGSQALAQAASDTVTPSAPSQGHAGITCPPGRTGVQRGGLLPFPLCAI